MPPAIVGQANAILFLVIALALTLVTLVRRRRPVTQSRVMDVSLSSILFSMVGLRYAVLAVVALAAPVRLFGVAAEPSLVVPAATLYAVVAAIGIAAHRGSVGWRLVGSLVFALVATIDLVMTLFLLPTTGADDLGAGLAFASAVLALVLAAFHWTNRTATPNPLASRERQLDY